jgi:hypothetical protein
MAILTLKVWDTPKENEDKDIFITAFFIALSLFMILYIGSGGATSPAAVFGNFASTTYIIGMLSFSLGIQLYSRNRPNSSKLYASVGKSKNYFWGMVIGTVLGVALVLGNVLFPKPQASAIAYDAFIALLYIITVVPFAEEKFFGRTVPYVVNSILKKPLVSTGIAGLVFAFFHIIANGLNATSLVMNFGFRVVIIYMNEKIQSSGFGDSWHYVTNFLSYATGKG